MSADFAPQHFHWQVDGRVGVITLNRPERKNPLTLESYSRADRHVPRAAATATASARWSITGAGGNFCSGGDVHDIIGPLVAMKKRATMDGLLAFTQMTGDLVKAMRACPQPIVAAVDGICVGAGAILAMASDLRLGTARSKVAFLFVKVGLSGADMGACAILPRIIGQGRASELLYTGRTMLGDEAERWGFYNRSASSRRRSRPTRIDARAIARRRAELRARRHEALPPRGVVDGRRPGDRLRGGDAGALHAERGFRARVPRVRREADAVFEGN